MDGTRGTCFMRLVSVLTMPNCRLISTTEFEQKQKKKLVELLFRVRSGGKRKIKKDEETSI
jgi:hypothetical protein